MPRHEFRTIEAFVQLLESDLAKFDAAEKNVALSEIERNRNGGAATAIWRVLDILRSSNLGIVYPPQNRATSHDTL